MNLKSPVTVLSTLYFTELDDISSAISVFLNCIFKQSPLLLRAEITFITSLTLRLPLDVNNALPTDNIPCEPHDTGGGVGRVAPVSLNGDEYNMNDTTKIRTIAIIMF